MRANRAIYPIANLCRVLGVSVSGYYAWQRRAPSVRAQGDAFFLDRIWNIHAASRGAYGAPRIHAELAAKSIPVGRKRIAGLVRAAGLAGVCRRKGSRTTRRREGARRAANLVERNFSAERPDQLWVATSPMPPPGPGFSISLLC